MVFSGNRLLNQNTWKLAAETKRGYSESISGRMMDSLGGYIDSLGGGGGPDRFAAGFPKAIGSLENFTPSAGAMKFLAG